MKKIDFNLSEIKKILFTTGFTFLVYLLGLIINKLVAVFGGPSGIALFGVTKAFHQFFGGLIKVGSDTVILNKTAKSKNEKELKTLLRSVIALFLLQTCFVLASIFIFHSLIYELVFSSVIPIQFDWLVSLILVLILASCFHEMILSFFNGLLEIRKVFIITFVGSFTTLLLTISIQPNNYGEIAFVSLSSGLFSSFCSMFLLKRKLSNFSSIFRKLSLSKFKYSNLPLSLHLMIQPLVVASCYLISQQLVARYLNVEALSFFIVAYTLVTLTLTLMMSSMRIFFLPYLGSLEDSNERNNFFNRTLYVFIPISVFVCLILVLFSEQIIILLYSEEFIEAKTFLSIFSCSVIVQTFNWLIATTILERNRYNFFVLADCTKEMLYLISCIVIVLTTKDLNQLFLGFLISNIVISVVYYTYIKIHKSELTISFWVYPMVIFLTLVIFSTYRFL